MNKSAVVQMTALVPTEGHLALIKFAADLVGTKGQVDVIVSGRSFEPVPVFDRVEALQDAIERERPNHNVSIWTHEDDDAPQNPATAEEWGYWIDVVRGTHDGLGWSVQGNYDYYVASEEYGKMMAELIDAEFVPFDMDRNIIYARGTEVRSNIEDYFGCIIPEMQYMLQKHVTIFGQESTGKTTLSEMLGQEFGTWTHEFARPYLEMMDDPTVTDEKMDVIVRGQDALHTASMSSGCAVVIHDTDLLSTIGYYRVYGGDSTGTHIEQRFAETKSDLYLVTPDNIPFVADPLRYGVTERETDLHFWYNLLEEYGCNYRILRGITPTERLIEARAIIREHANQWFGPIRDFVRD